MKSSLLKLISAVSITAISLLSSLPVLAQTKDSVALERSITTFSLVSQAQQGRFKNQGISGYGALKTQYKLHQVTAKNLVKAGIDNHLISTETLQNQDYLNDVNLQLLQRIND